MGFLHSDHTSPSSGKRRVRITLAIAGILIAGLVDGVVAQSQQRPKEIEEKDDRPQGAAALRVDVQQIQIDITVRDKKGNLITGLTQDNFTVYEDKVEQEVLTFASVEAPMTAVLVVEYSKAINWEMLYEAWQASRYFLSTMREGDWIGVVAYDIRPEILVDFTQNKAKAFSALSKLNYPAFSESNLYDTLIDTLDRLEEVKGKVAIVLVSSGLDTFSKSNLDKALRATKNTNVAIYPIAVGGNFLARNEHRLGTVRLDFYQAEAALKAFAKNSGGEAYFPKFVQAFPGIFQNISQMLRSAYSVSYVSSNPKTDGKFRKLRIDVKADINGDGKPDKLKIAHKQGYYAGGS